VPLYSAGLWGGVLAPFIETRKWGCSFCGDISPWNKFVDCWRPAAETAEISLMLCNMCHGAES
jgi:hypothetical protein